MKINPPQLTLRQATRDAPTIIKVSREALICKGVPLWQ